MSLRNISTKEYQRISKICERAHGAASNEPFTNHLYGVLKEALPSIHFMSIRFALSPLALTQALNESLPTRSFKNFMHQHPGIRSYCATRQKVGSLLTELDPADYRKTELYNEIYRSFDIEDQVWIGVGNRNEVIAISYSRDNAYTEQDLLTLSLIQPQAQIAWENWQRTRAFKTQLQNMQESRIQSDEQARAAAAMKRKFDALTPRRREIVELVAAGKTNLEIAADLKISYRTVEKHLEHIFNAVGVRNRTALLYETGLKGKVAR